MASTKLSQHAQDMLNERNIQEAWLWQTLSAPDDTWRGTDGHFHYVKVMDVRGRRVLHVVVDDKSDPRRVVTIFFDRRLQL